MLFSSLEFIAVFLPVALAGTALAVRLGGRAAAVAWLILASLAFYGWHHPPHLLLLGASLAINFLFARALARSRSGLLLAAGVGFNLAAIAVFKYAGFLAETVALLGGGPATLPAIALPLAISFFTFQQIAYLADVHAGKAQPHSFGDYVLFIVFFPQLIAGPIVHHAEFVPELAGRGFARFRPQDVFAGLVLFGIGLAKKTLLADPLGALADPIYAAVGLDVPVSMAEAWVAALAYAGQIYFDFSGYSDMALGLGRLFGIRLPVNFDSPYRAANIAEFWRRWHMTLSRFLRDYLYIPLGGNRHGQGRRYLNLFLVMALGGLWHGAAWTFVAWGVLHGLYLAVHRAWRALAGSRVRMAPPAAGCLTFLAVTVAWVFFRAADFGQAFAILGAMAGQGAADAPLSLALAGDAWQRYAALALGYALIWCAPNANRIVAAIEDGAIRPARLPWLAAGVGAATAVSLGAIYAVGSYEFIYFQF
ncbi:MAG: MBOAT family O-acyltransferase [Alphaproteobacteria bacterium]